GSRNFADFIDLMDAVFVLEVDIETLNSRLDARGPDEWGGRPDQRELILRLHRTQDDVPTDAISIDATAPIERVVDEILRLTEGVAGA
ncbi:MAG TPA: nucleoside kinase, partial [Propionicimonas sp.]|nr:nucleoside kinase [Propionicimonas sp.]HQA78736.1 nucleoside kinase [Propionicimonas sp.]